MAIANSYARHAGFASLMASENPAPREHGATAMPGEPRGGFAVNLMCLGYVNVGRRAVARRRAAQWVGESSAPCRLHPTATTALQKAALAPPDPTSLDHLGYGDT